MGQLDYIAWRLESDDIIRGPRVHPAVDFLVYVLGLIVFLGSILFITSL